MRDGFYVSEMMKRYWAGHLTVLSAIDKICKKHDIPWFADYGTLLGAVRHKGFIPWDDDVDIIMLRHDLQRFLEIAPSELPDGMETVDIQTQDDTENTVAAVISDPARADHMAQFQGCPYRCCVDIMALDGCYENPEEEAMRRERFREVFEAASYFVRQDEPLRGGVYTEAELYPKEAAAALHRAEKISGMKAAPGKNRLIQVLKMLMKVAREVPDTEAEILDRFFAPRGIMPYQKKWYAKSVRIPFEHTEIPVPAMYEDVLALMYGDWRKVIRGGAVHDYPSYRDQEAALKKRLGGNPFRYTFSMTDWTAQKDLSPAEKLQQLMPVFEKARQTAESLVMSGKQEAAAPLLARMETMAEQAEALSAIVTRQRKEVLFLPVRPAWWNTMDAAYRAACAEEDTDVYVIPVPWYERDAEGNPGARHDEAAGFPAEVPLTAPEDYDIEARHPDRIVIQFPFDDTNRSMVIDRRYCASVLRNLTDCLVYIPCYEAASPAEGDIISRIALQTLVEQPAVVFADEIWLPDEEMCGVYADTLYGLGGEGIRGMCEAKMRVYPASGEPAP